MNVSECDGGLETEGTFGGPMRLWFFKARSATALVCSVAMALGSTACARWKFPASCVCGGAVTATRDVCPVDDDCPLGVVGFRFQHFGDVEFLTVGASYMAGGDDVRICEAYAALDAGYFFYALADPPGRKGPWWPVFEPGLGMWVADTNEHAGLMLMLRVGAGRIMDTELRGRHAVAIAWVGRSFQDYRNDRDGGADAVEIAWTWGDF